MPTTAVTNATYVDEIGFPEFTASLIGSTFDALISANIRQMSAYAELVDMISEDITTFINNTKDDITGDEALAFLERILPAYENEGTNSTRVYEASVLSEEEASRLTKAVKLPNKEGLTSITVSSGSIDGNELKDIIAAVSKRLACNKYQMLQQMVNQGILRIVIEKGVLESRLSFSTWDYSNISRKTTDYSRDTSSTRQSSSRGIFGSLFLGPSSKSARTTKLHVKTDSQNSYAAQGTNVNLTGSVQLFFKTDYLPLEQKEG